jgi:H+/Cl- antiporter ClcA
VYVFGNPAVRSGAFGGWKRVWTTQRIHRAPFTGVVVLAEMTNVFTLLLPLLGVAMIGYFVGALSGAKAIYERLLEVSREKAE